jgi:hypothetical protein
LNERYSFLVEEKDLYSLSTGLVSMEEKDNINSDIKLVTNQCNDLPGDLEILRH